jgi:hypothetical protein
LKHKWEAGFSALSLYKEENGNCLVSKRHKTQAKYNLEIWVSTQRAKKQILSSKQIQRLDDIGFIWDQSDKKWEEGIKALRAYKKENGDCLVPTSYKSENKYALGKWVGRVRQIKNSLTLESIKLLNELSFVWDLYEQKWEEGFKELSDYKKEKGDCLVPGLYKTENKYSLGRWVSSQRQKKKILSQKQIQRLDQLGFIWDALKQRWEEGFKELSDYKKEKGDCLVPGLYKTENKYSLGRWVLTQKARERELTPEMVQRLNELGFVW